MFSKGTVKAVLLSCALPALGLTMLPDTATAAETQLRRSLSSLNGGSYYTSKVIDEGVIQLTECKPFPGDALKNTRGPFHCAPDGVGFRCTSEKTLDVIFVFQNQKECAADRKRNFDNEGQE